MSSVPTFTLSDLDVRSRDIFRDVVEGYLESGLPVGSKTLALSGGRSLSPATIRSVMAELSRYGLLTSPHVSAGRIPTQVGLRLFVDGLLEIGDLGKTEQNTLESKLAAAGEDPEALMQQASAMMAGLAGGAGLVLAPQSGTSERALRHVEFVNLDGDQALVVLVHEDGAVENRIMARPAGVLPGSLERAGNFLSARLKGRRTDVERIRQLFDDLERKEELIDLMDRAEDADGVKIFIGSENPLFSLSGSSVVIAPYRDQQSNILGALGVIGPTRLNYARVIPMMDYTAQVLGRLLKR